MASTPPLSSALIDQAIAWAVKIDFNHPSAATRQAFEHWRAASEMHEAAWQYVSGVRTTFAQVPGKLALGVLESAQRSRDADRERRRRVVKLLMLSGAVGAGAWMTHEHAPWQRLLADASTGVGQRSTLQLQDGTVLTLNTDSAVSVRMEATRRVVVARRGEISIATGTDAEFVARTGTRRGFWVETPFGMLQALGTRFVVRLERDRARVSVQEGAVEMRAVQGGSAVAWAGQSWWFTAAGSRQATPAGLSPDAWEDGVIVADNVRLEDFLGELSRYRAGSLACDAGIADLRISGIYHIDDTDQVLRFLASTQPVDVIYRTRFWVRVTARTRA